jgi:hypothetical protein
VLDKTGKRPKVNRFAKRIVTINFKEIKDKEIVIYCEGINDERPMIVKEKDRLSIYGKD